MIEFFARTAVGVLIRSFETEDQARKWLKEKGHRYPGCALYEREVITTVREAKLPARKRSHLRLIEAVA
jgi:hypothetical protein